MKFFNSGGPLGIAQGILGLTFAVLVVLFGIQLIGDQFPDALPAVGWFLGRLIQLSSDEYVAEFMGDRVLVSGLVGVALLLWVTHKWPTLIKTIGQALNPFARIGVAAVSAVAAVLVALILAGPLGQSKTKGECTSAFRLNLDNAPSLVSNTTCGGGVRDQTSRD
ncbi:hypothetical protein AB0D66_25645 [Streptomyces sp. NPDC048270]|uniref:hypothetical protein n=1 Tax=Streptomyces sp. NPDC048270 TaxID=3154615 RepID=UPI0033FC3BF5